MGVGQRRGKKKRGRGFAQAQTTNLHQGELMEKTRVNHQQSSAATVSPTDMCIIIPIMSPVLINQSFLIVYLFIYFCQVDILTLYDFVHYHKNPTSSEACYLVLTNNYEYTPLHITLGTSRRLKSTLLNTSLEFTYYRGSSFISH